MRYLLILLIFFPFFSQSAENPLADNKVTCEEMKNYPEIVFKLQDLGSGSGSPNQVDYKCPKSLSQLDFLQDLIAQASGIRMPSQLPQYCTGSIIHAQWRYYHFALAKLGYFPQGASYRKRGKMLGMAYFEEWSYQSLYNRDIYNAFMEEIKIAKPKLEHWYRENHNVDSELAAKYTDIALQAISNYGFGSYFYYWKPESLVPNTKEATQGDLKDFWSQVSSSSDEQKLNTLRRLLVHDVPTSLIESFAATIAVKSQTKRSESIISSAVKNPSNLRALLDLGFSMEHQNVFGKTALYYAIQYNQHESVKLLLSYGVNVNHAYNQEKENKWSCSGIKQWGRTPLMHAAQHADVEMINLLVSAGANTKAKDVNGATAFDYAKNSNKEMNARFLLDLIDG